MDKLQTIAALINTSTTGCIATIMDDRVSVQVPGLQSLPNGLTTKFYSTETVFSLAGARSLIASMQ